MPKFKNRFVWLHVIGIMLSCACAPFIMEYRSEKAILLTPYGRQFLAPFFIATFLLLFVPSPILVWLLRGCAQTALRVPTLLNSWPARIAAATVVSVVLGVALGFGWGLATVAFDMLSGGDFREPSWFVTEPDVALFTQSVAALWLLPSLLVLRQSVKQVATESVAIIHAPSRVSAL